MAMSNLAISMGNYWQGMIAERMGYAQVLYMDALIALLVIALIPFLRARDEPAEPVAPIGLQVVPAAVTAGDSSSVR
jgi:predicted MFS family arabinose efflux permease